MGTHSKSMQARRKTSVTYLSQEQRWCFFQSGTSSQGMQWWTPHLPLMCFARQIVGWRFPSICADPAFPDNFTSLLLWKIHTIQSFSPFFLFKWAFYGIFKYFIESKRKTPNMLYITGRKEHLYWIVSRKLFIFAGFCSVLILPSNRWVVKNMQGEIHRTWQGIMYFPLFFNSMCIRW